MRVYIFIISAVFFCLSCNNKKANNQKFKNEDTLVHVENDTLKNQVKGNNKKRILATDTTLTFSIDGLSSEGSEVKAHYIYDTIRNALWNIYGETGQSVIQYEFLKNGTVKTYEKNYTYKTDLTGVKSEKGMILKSSLHYILDTTGVLLSKINDKDFVNVFTDFKEHVPMTLSNLNY